MKKFWFAILALLLLFGFSFAWTQQVTPNLKLVIQTPPQYANNWGAITNYNFEKLDGAVQLSTIIGTGTTPALSCSATANKNVFWIGTDLSLWMCSNVSSSYSWGRITAAGGGGGSIGAGTAGQFPYYAANGTTLTATSDINSQSSYIQIGGNSKAVDLNSDRGDGPFSDIDIENNTPSITILSVSPADDTTTGGNVTIQGTGSNGEVVSITASDNGTGLHPAGNILIHAVSTHDGSGKIQIVSHSDTTIDAPNIAVDNLGNLTLNGTGCGAGTYAKADGTGCGTPSAPAWGSITGTLSSQTDLQSALNAKWNVPTFSTVVALWASGSCTSGYLKFDGTCSTPGGGSIDVNGSPVSGTPNFNATTPSAPAGATNQTYQVDGSGNISNYDYSVQYQNSSTVTYLIGDSRLVSSSDTIAGTKSTTATAVSCDGTTCTVTAANSYTTSDWVTFWFVTWSPTCMESSMAPVTSATGTQFTVDENRTFCTGVTSGTGAAGNNVAYATHTVAPLLSQMPYLKNHGKVVMLLRQADGGGTYALWNTAYTANIHPFAPNSTSIPANMFIHLGYDDLRNSGCPSLATLEGQAQTLWTSLLNDGFGIIESSESTNVTGDAVTCGGGNSNLILFNNWKMGQSPGAASSHWTDFIDLAAPLGQSLNTSLWADSNHYGNGGNYLAASTINNRFASQGSINRGGMPGSGWNDFFGYQTFSLPTGTSNADVIGIGSNGSTSADYTLGDASGVGFLKTSGNLNARWGWNSGLTTAEFALPSDGVLGFLNGTDAAFSTRDTGLSRDSAGVVDIGNGTKGNKSGTLNAANINVTGTCTGCSTPTTFSAITGSTNTTAAMVVGAGSSLAPASTGTIQATNIGSTIAVTAPITVTGSGTTSSPYTIACPTCGTGSGGTSVSQNSGGAETNLPITGYMPQVCADTSASGTAQVCSVANTFTPQAGNCVVYKTTTANSGTALTVNVNSLGAKSIAVAGSSGWTTTLVASNSIPANKPMNLCYDGTNWDASGTGYLPSGAGSTTNITSSLTPTGCTITGNTCVVGIAVAAINFASIPGTYNHLKVSMSGTVSGASSASVSLQFNGDTASNYAYSYMFATNAGGPSKTTSVLGNVARGCILGATGTGGGGSFEINNYTSGFEKTVVGTCTSIDPTATWSGAWDYSGFWTGTAAITSINMFPSTGNFSAGDIVEVYGIN